MNRQLKSTSPSRVSSKRRRFLLIVLLVALFNGLPASGQDNSARVNMEIISVGGFPLIDDDGSVRSDGKLVERLLLDTDDPGAVGEIQLIGLDSRSPPLNVRGEPAILYGFCHPTAIPVYLGGRTGMSLPPFPPHVRGKALLFCQSPRYVKNSPSASATFEVVPSYLLVRTVQPVDNEAMMRIAVNLVDDKGKVRFQFEHSDRLVGHGGTPAVASFTHEKNGPMPTESELLLDFGQLGEVINVRGARVDLKEPYVGVIDLSSIAVGSQYSIVYELEMLLESSGVESWAEGILRDPLDVDTGIRFLPDAGSTLAPSSQAVQLCNDQQPESTPDSRFTVQDNATVADLITGLVWPRCPQGYELEDSGTNDLADDTCVAGMATEFSWSDALAEASSANTAEQAGITDWRLPNIKELHSIVEYSCNFPAMNPQVFPPFLTHQTWSSTANDVGTAEYIAFDNGLLRSASQSTLHSVRLVRTGALTLPPVDDNLFADGFE